MNSKLLKFIVKIKLCFQKKKILECEKIVYTEGMHVETRNKISWENDNLFSGTIVDFTCNKSYVISNSEKVSAKCLESGEWNVTAPHCVKC